MERKKKIVVGVYVCLFALIITVCGVIIGFSASNGDFLSPFEMNYTVKKEILSDNYGYYVEMGEYPQTFAGYVSSTSYISSGETFTYVDSDGNEATANVYTDSSGNRYIQYTAAAYSTSYYYSDYTSTTTSEATWFKIEPIKWRILGYYEDSAYTNAVVDSTASFVQVTEVLDDNYSALVTHSDAIVVQSELGLEAVQWYTSNSDVDYTGSTIYNWLENFYSEILSSYDSYISSRTIDYNDTSETSSSQTDTAALTTSEKIWLLSYTEAITYYSSETGVSEDRYCSPSDFALATYCYMNTNHTSNYRTGTSHWWLRSSYLHGSYYLARFVDSLGYLDYTDVNYSDGAVRPAMLLNLSSDDDSGSSSASTVEILSDDYGYYVNMGEYPQTFAGYVSSTSYTSSGETFTYVGSDGNEATANVYTDSSGNRYIQYTAAACSTSYYYSDYISTTTSEATWFKIEPIKWRILGYYEDSAYTNALVDGTAVFVQVTSVSDDNYSALVAHSDAIVVQSELGLEAVQWYTSNSDVDYTGSTIYNWLDTFYSTILETNYDSYISSRTIDYNDTSEYDLEANDDEYADTVAYKTSEKIWLLSYTEANGLYYTSSSARLSSPSDFGLATGCFLYTITSSYTTSYRSEGGTGIWWLRSSFIDLDYCRACDVYDGGYIDYDDININVVAVRPAMLLNLSNTDDSGSGDSGDSGSGTEIVVYCEILSDDYGYYVNMGEYPQTFAGYTSDVTFTDSGEDFTYVAKDGTTATADVYADSSGNRYIIYNVAALYTDYTFVDGTATESGDAYFKLEPIKWRILGYYEDSAYTNALVDGTAVFVQVTSVSDENYNALVAHSDAIIVQSEFGLEGVPWYTSFTTDVDYTGSTIYNWLENFYSEILSGYDSYISSRTIDYNDTSATSISQYDTAALTTSEKVWLISYTEANGVYYSSNAARYCSPSDFGLATYISMSTSYTSNYRTGTCYWWLRSSDLGGNYSARSVCFVGVIRNYGMSDDSYAVRPALLLNLSGNGTNATATSVSSITESGSSSVSETLLTSTASTETAILTTASASEKRRIVLCVEN